MSKPYMLFKNVIISKVFCLLHFNLWYNEYKFMSNLKIRAYQTDLWELDILRLTPTGHYGFCESCLVCGGL